MDRDRAALRPAGEHRRERRDADRAGAERAAGVGRDQALVDVVAPRRRRRRARADRRRRLDRLRPFRGRASRAARTGRRRSASDAADPDRRSAHVADHAVRAQRQLDAVPRRAAARAEYDAADAEHRRHPVHVQAPEGGESAPAGTARTPRRCAGRRPRRRPAASPAGARVPASHVFPGWSTCERGSGIAGRAPAAGAGEPQRRGEYEQVQVLSIWLQPFYPRASESPRAHYPRSAWPERPRPPPDPPPQPGRRRTRCASRPASRTRSSGPSAGVRSRARRAPPPPRGRLVAGERRARVGLAAVRPERERPLGQRRDRERRVRAEVRGDRRSVDDVQARAPEDAAVRVDDPVARDAPTGTPPSTCAVVARPSRTSFTVPPAAPPISSAAMRAARPASADGSAGVAVRAERRRSRPSTSGRAVTRRRTSRACIARAGSRSAPTSAAAGARAGPAGRVRRAAG